MKLYDEHGWADMKSVMSLSSSIIVGLGGRGIGKTYGGFKHLLYELHEPFIYMRRTQSQVDTAGAKAFSPFNSLNLDFDDTIMPKAITKYSYGYYRTHIEDDKTIFEDKPVAVSMALSTISSQRGFDASAFKWVLFDEFIPEKHERQIIKNEGQAFLNAYETLNRNRELKGQEPLKVLLLGNTNTPDSDILDSLGLADVVDIMRRSKRTMYTKGSITVINFKDSPISERKKKTVLYQLSADSEFNDMALSNKFAAGSYEHILDKGIDIKQFKPFVAYEDVKIYKHKHDSLFFVTDFESGVFKHYSSMPTEKAQFINIYGNIIFAYQAGMVKFKNYKLKKQFLKIFEK